MARRLLAFILLFVFTAVIARAATPRDPYQHFFEQTLGDLTEELEIAREEGKHGLFVFFEMDECPFCHRMKQTVLNQPDVQDWYKARFHSLAIDIEGDVEMVDFDGNSTTLKAFASQNRVRATPLLAFFDLDGQRLFKYVGAPADKAEFLLMGQFIADKVYLRQDDNGRPLRFSRYKRLQQQQNP